MEFEKKKNQIQETYGKKIKNLNNKFGNSNVDFYEEHLQNSTSGLFSNSEFKQKKDQLELFIVNEQQKEIIQKLNTNEADQKEGAPSTKKDTRIKNQLSFIDEEE